MAIPDYKLSAILCGHSLDVRCVATTKEDCILSASRDKTGKLWHPEGVKEFVNVVTYKGHKNFVSSICWLPPCETFPEGLVVTGSNDNAILGYNLQDGTVVLTLEGHENAVVYVTPGRESGILLSSSWDSAAKIWNVNNPQGTPLTLKGHQAAVWCVVELGNGTYATASADKTIILWNKNGQQIKLLTGHTDCVRALTVANTDSFLSCANDASIRLWTNKGECLNTYYGHSNYIYSISMNPGAGDGLFTSCGEDGSVRLWQGGDCLRTIAVPATSVWSVACLSNGDIVTGSSDGLVRVFTKDPERYASETILKQYEEEVEKLQAASMQEIGGFKLSELPGPEVLLEPGKTDGQTKLVRRGANVKCYSWSVATQSWTEIGDVMGSKPPAEGKTTYQGEEYDFVFSVDIKDGAPPLKLPYNKNEDPWVAAQAFIHKHELPQVYLDQVANFIVTNAKLDSLPASSNGVADPLTGESRYVPGATSASAARPAGPAPDPFTGSGAYTTTSATSLNRTLIPHRDYVTFKQANLKAIYDKLKEFNSKVGDGLTSMTDEQLENVVKLGEADGTYNPDSLNVLKKMLEWPKEVLFPVLDITRLAIRNKDVNAQLFDGTYGPPFIQFLLSLLTPDNLAANQMLSLRVLVNAFAALPGEMLALAANEALQHALLCLTDLNKNAQIAAASLLLNLSVALGQQSDTSDLTETTVRLLDRIQDPEAYFRALVALGTLLAESPNKLQLQTKIVSNVLFHNRLKKDAARASTDPALSKITSCAQQILTLL